MNEPKNYNEKHFVFNFLQQEEAAEDDSASDATLKQALIDANLAHF